MVGTYVLAYAADQALIAVKGLSLAIGYSPTRPVLPIVGVHVSLLAWIAAACLSTALAARISPGARVTAIAVVFAAPLGFGTVRDAARWAVAAPVEPPASLVRACSVGANAPADVTWDGRRYRLERAHAVTLNPARVRLDASGAVLVRLSGPTRPLAERSRDAVYAPSDPCRFDALVVDGEVRSVAHFTGVIEWGTLSIASADAERQRRLFADLAGKTRP